MMPGFPGKSAKSGTCRKQGNLENWLEFFWHMKPGYHYFHSNAAIKDKTTLNRFHSIKWCKDHWILVDLTKSIYKWCWFYFAKIKCKYQLFKWEHQIKTAAWLACKLFKHAICPFSMIINNISCSFYIFKHGQPAQTLLVLKIRPGTYNTGAPAGDLLQITSCISCVYK